MATYNVTPNPSGGGSVSASIPTVNAPTLNLPNPAAATQVGQFQFGQAPAAQGFTFGQNQAVGGFQGVANSAQNGTIQNFNRAANRLRERIDMATRSQQNGAINAQLGRGFGASGSTQGAIADANLQGLQAYGQGLVQLEDSFEQNRLRGLGLANDAYSGISNSFLEGERLRKDFTQSLNDRSADLFKDTEGRRFDNYKFGEIENEKRKQQYFENLFNKEKFASETSLKAKIANASAAAAALGANSNLIGQLLNMFGSGGGAGGGTAGWGGIDDSGGTTGGAGSGAWGQDS